MSAKALLTAEESASLLKIARRTLLRWARERKIESLRVSSKVILFTTDAIESFLAARTVEVKPMAVPLARVAMRKARRLSKQRGRKSPSAQTWEELKKEVLSCIDQDKR